MLKRAIVFLALALASVPAQAQRGLSVSDGVTVEGQNACSTVSASGPLGQTATFNYQFIGGEATAPADFTAKSGQQSVRKNASKITLCTATTQDTIFENDERLFVKISPVRNATIVRATGTQTIRDDDPAPLPPVQCPDGSTVPAGQTCPVPPPVDPPPVEPPPPGDILVPSLDGLPPIVAFPDPSGGLETWSYEFKSAAPDVVGAVRLTCGFAGVGRFDPKVYPGDHTGKSHLHQFYGNMGINPDSTYESNRTTGKSGCNYGDVTLQRSAYWQPAMFDGKGNVRQPDHITLYYKRRPHSDPVVSAPPGTPITPLRSTDQKFAQGIGVDLPHGLFYIFGYDFITGTPATGEVDFACFPKDGSASVSAKADAGGIAAIAASGKCTVGSQFATRGHGGSCWDGKRADSANHRDHITYPQYGTWGYLRCDAAHPYVIPTISLLSTWIIRDTDDLSLWSLSSDVMAPGKPAGYTFHADIWPEWEPAVIERMERGCLDKMLNCSGGRLDETTALKNAGQPQYPDATGKLVKSWLNPQWSIPIPGPEANDKLVGFTY